ncbi:DUF445 domain-containing protein [Lampropedia puyangensis]|uniref:DUF445 domain-containing protein n=1 Tax=Lampropedia puyangensis TaxID=1330072 RepID=A0A4S8FBE2_9BURK|nr:DUF445 domain-containing protein [Lampropedia puyangensis]THU04993.1 DUF445 domain-containing protein [Lampropedia puyangensis]
MRHPLALFLLIVVTALYAVATALRHQHPLWPYVAAFAEAGMVGALADWFAVVAMFRHPMGIPIPHTAVLAKNQQRLGQGLADFIDRNFLSLNYIRNKLAQWDAAHWLAQWLQSPGNAQRLLQPLLATTRFGLEAMDDTKVRAFFTRNVRSALQQMDVSNSSAAVLDSLTAQGRHQELLDDLTAQLARAVESESTQQHITQAIAKELRALRYLALDQAAARLTTRKIINAIARNLKDMGESADHPMRQRLDQAVQNWIMRLKADPELQAKANQLRDQILEHPQLNTYLEHVWADLLRWLSQDLRSSDSPLTLRLEAGITHMGRELAHNPDMQAWVNTQIQELGPQVVDYYRPAIRRHISDRVGEWDTRELIDEVESHLSKDLQYIRINGTLVGGLVGLAIFSVTQWLIGS